MPARWQRSTKCMKSCGDPCRLVTHFESDYGASPKVEMKLGTKMTVIDPDFDNKVWLGFEGEVIDNPFLDICRSQTDIQIKGDCDQSDSKKKDTMLVYQTNHYVEIPKATHTGLPTGQRLSSFLTCRRSSRISSTCW